MLSGRTLTLRPGTLSSMRLANDWWKSKAVPQGVNADISDGSGDLKVLNVGSLDATDGSGGIDVNKVGRDFKVESKGSGSIEYSGSNQRPVCVPRRVSCIIICAARSVRSRTFIA